jgi:hypothetical protein
MKTIAQQLGITDFPFEIKDKQGNEIYYEFDGYWAKSIYDSFGREIYGEDSDKYWVKKQYDSDGNVIYCEDSRGFWWKREYDSDGKAIYIEDCDGVIIDDRPKEE